MSVNEPIGKLSRIILEDDTDSQKKILKEFLGQLQELIGRYNELLEVDTRMRRETGRRDTLIIFAETFDFTHDLLGI